jgi:glycosyltransferase involved in cell wall biosynthesis
MRIFWLGMHRVLVQTELPQLRELGFEVFCPAYRRQPYLGRAQDQSAQYGFDADQPTTLPRDVFDRLGSFNFFYNQIPSSIGELLNTYFDAVIVTINADWLGEILRVYRGKVIYRVYGETRLVSQMLWQNGAAELAAGRDNFWYVPHTQHIALYEHAWLRDRMAVVPYHVTADVMALKDTWSGPTNGSPEIMMSCANIDNMYFRTHYVWLKQNFTDQRFRFYGVQLRRVTDPQVVGTVPRAELLRAMQRCAGFLYSYRDPNLCYLPPIETMIIGGPVIYLSGSLLDRYFNGRTPGYAKDPEEAHRKAQMLLRGDLEFAREVIASQDEVRRRYTPEFVRPLFAQTMSDLLREGRNEASPIIAAPGASGSRKRVYVLFHQDYDAATRFRDGVASHSEGIARVMRTFARGLIERTTCEVVVTTRAGYAMQVLSFFRDDEDARYIKIQTIDALEIKRPYSDGWLGRCQLGMQRIREFQYARLPDRLSMLGALGGSPDAPTLLGHTEEWFAERLPRSRRGRVAMLLSIAAGTVPFLVTRTLLRLVKRTAVAPVRWLATRVRFQLRMYKENFGFLLAGLPSRIDADPSALAVVVPHYSVFPEAVLIKTPMIVYIPDHIPHFYHDTGMFPGEGRAATIGRMIARRAKYVFTNSQYSAGYLPDTWLRVPPEKIRIFPLPRLNESSRRIEIDESPLLLKITKDLRGRRFIFYPTQNRPNKNLSLLVRVFAALLAEGRDLALVLTGSIAGLGVVGELFEQDDLRELILSASGATDAELRWLYENCACLCLTSGLEGNFPPQINEALHYGAPVVATRLPMITEMLAEQADSLLLCRPGDPDDFVAKVAVALDRRKFVLHRQKVAHRILAERSSFELFAEGVGSMIGNIDSSVVRAVPHIEGQRSSAFAAAK